MKFKGVYLIGFLLLYLSLFSQDKARTVIFWDTSTSRIYRDSLMEMKYLDAYFKRFQDTKVLLVGFSDTVRFKEDFTINAGDWTALRTRIQDIRYDGATSFQGLESLASDGYHLFFTDGTQNLNKTTPKFGGETVVINSSPKYDTRTINLLSILGKAEFLNLSANTRTKRKDSTVAGAQNVIKSDSAKLDMKKGVRLEEVVVTETQKNPDTKENMALGKKDKDALGYAVQSIGSERILDAATTVNTGIQGKFSGVALAQNDDLSRAVLRPSNSLLGNNYGLIVVDGVPLPQSQSSANGIFYPTSFLDPKNIEDVTVLKGLAATNIYGTLGANGVLLITTKTGSYGSADNESSNAMQLKDNFYDTKIKIDTKALITPYLKELKKGKNVRSAYDIYLNQREKFKGEGNYWSDVFDFFYASSPDVAFRILSNVLEMESPTYEMLRAAYLKSSTVNNHDLALAIVNRLILDYPAKIQYSFDFAVVNRNLARYLVALNTLYALIQNEINASSKPEGFGKSLGSEIRNLINSHRSNLDVSKVDLKYQNNITYNARLILEWSNPEAEFVVQFVNPQKRFFDWEHTRLSNVQEFTKALEVGSAMEQFEILGAETVGEWILNVTPLAGSGKNSDYLATFLKCTVVKNFGRPNQKQASYMVRLQEPNEKKQLAKFIID